MATQGGARAVQLADQIGALALGMLADIVLNHLTARRWVTLNDPVQHLVHVEDGRSVDTVLIDGRVVIEQGTIRTFDVAALLAEARPMLAAIRVRNGTLSQVAQWMAEVMLCRVHYPCVYLSRYSRGSHQSDPHETKERQTWKNGRRSWRLSPSRAMS